MNDLANRAVACKGWRWMPGMLYHMPNWGPVRMSDNPAMAASMKGCESAVLDLTDPATLGCLLHLVREAYPDYSVQYTVYAPPDVGMVEIVFIGNEWQFEHDERGGSLVVALEAAP